MFRREVTDLLNTGESWVFVGAGASCDAGAPNWKGLLDAISSQAQAQFGVDLKSDVRYATAYRATNYSRALSRVQTSIGRPGLEALVRAELSRFQTPGEILQTIVNWPAAGYVTTNYDDLLERGLQAIKQSAGWIEAGNSDSEIRKLSADPKRVVWHIHGAIGQAPDRFKLILTEEDYDDFYLEGSRTVTQLGALLMQRQVMFVGFGFADPELLRLLKIVRRYSNPAKPILAFIGSDDPLTEDQLKNELFEHYNVDAIPYLIRDGNHSHLIQLLKIYTSFVLRRTQRFGAPDRPCRSYDSSTTALLVYNELALTRPAQLTTDVVTSLMRSRILSLLKFCGHRSVEDIREDLIERVRLIGRQPSIQDETSFDDAILSALEGLGRDGLVVSGTDFALSTVGLEVLDSQAAAAQRLHAQFQSCLLARAKERLSHDSVSSEHVAQAAEAFLMDTIERRALGLAMVSLTPGQFQQYHIVALLQNLPKFFDPLTPAEAVELVGVVQDFLAGPTEDEARYLGLALQAQFSLNLLGYDAELVKARLHELQRTVFLFDSSTILYLIARSATGSDAAAQLIAKLRRANAPLLTTQLLLTEVAEHARWAVRHLSKHSILSTETLMWITGRAGYRQNLFIEAFLKEINAGRATLDFGAYLDSVCGHKGGHLATDDAFEEATKSKGIEVRKFENWEGFQNVWFAERDELQESIAEIRRGKKTYKHERQTQAEAEAVIIIERLRSGEITSNGETMHDAYFISNTRFIDRVKDFKVPITMSPSAALQWLSTMTPVPANELGTLTTSIIWELSERGFTVVDRKGLQQAFSPLINASKEQETEVMAHYSSLTANRYGVDPAKAFSGVSDLDLPVALHIYSVKKARDLEDELAKERTARQAAESKAKLREKDEKEYQRLKLKQTAKHRKSKAKQRSSQSKRKSGKK